MWDIDIKNLTVSHLKHTACTSKEIDGGALGLFEPLILHFQHRYCPRKWGMKKKVHFYWNTSVSLVSKDQTPNGAAQTGLAVEADAVGPIFLGPTVRQPTVWSKSCRKPPAATWTDTYVTIRERERERGGRANGSHSCSTIYVGENGREEE